MKTAVIAICLCTLPLAGAALTQAERDALLAQIDKSSRTFLASLEGVSEAQWNFKPAPDRWSIAECAEHVAITDQMMFIFVTGQLLKMPVPEKPEHRGDDAVLSTAADRSKKVKTAEFLEPKGRFHSRAELVAAFEANRAKIVDYVKTTPDDLRSHGAEGPAGYLDGYQFFLSASAHGERHSQQIAEVKADPGYPKK